VFCLALACAKLTAISTRRPPPLLQKAFAVVGTPHGCRAKLPMRGCSSPGKLWPVDDPQPASVRLATRQLDPAAGVVGRTRPGESEVATSHCGQRLLVFEMLTRAGPRRTARHAYGRHHAVDRPPGRARAARAFPRKSSRRRLADETFIDFPPGWGNRAVVDRAFAAAGLERQVFFEVADFATAAGPVRHNLGVAFLPAPPAAKLSGLRAFDVAGGSLNWEMFVATPAGRRLRRGAGLPGGTAFTRLITHGLSPARHGRRQGAAAAGPALAKPAGRPADP